MPYLPNLDPALGLVTKARAALPLHLVSAAELDGWLKRQSAFVRNWVKDTGFTASAQDYLLLPDTKGQLAGVLVGIAAQPDLLALAHLPNVLPLGTYELAGNIPAAQQQHLALGWALGSYRFDKYLRKPGRAAAQLLVGKQVDVASLTRTARATYLVRDLINEPANILGPDELAQAGVALAKKYKAKATLLRGEQLLQKNYPAIYAVGKGSERPPVLLDLRWGRAKAPRLTLVGKGVVFDTGGYDIKPSSGMLTMKKDMGGAAHVLALAGMIMDAGLDVQLRVLVAAVENSISGRAMRPMDIYPTRSGQTIEIGNTDAEGRVILSDCLDEASREQPEWLIDFATLTGARSVALGTDIPALFSNDDGLANQLLASAKTMQDPLWRLPMHKPYWKSMKSKIADMNNAGGSGYGGAITAALFLQQFVPDAQPWAHIDLMAWNTSSQPGRPEGGEAMGLRAVYAAIESRFSKSRA